MPHRDFSRFGPIKMTPELSLLYGSKKQAQKPTVAPIRLMLDTCRAESDDMLEA